jgi:hypothetical protein
MKERGDAMGTKDFDEMIEFSEPEGFYGAGILLRHAANVFDLDHASTSTWVVLGAIDTAENELRDAVDQGDDMNVVEARVAAIRLRLGIDHVRCILSAGGMAEGAMLDHADDADTAVVRGLQEAAKKCFVLWCELTGHRVIG